MFLDYHDYTTLLKAELDRKRTTGNLPLLLVQPSPGNVRRECENVYKERCYKKDEPALRAFFGPAENQKQFLKLIEDFPVDKFRPLVKYIKGGTGNTDEKNIELLAWLIDFRHRPYWLRKSVVLSDEEQIVLGKELPDSEEKEREENEKEENERVKTEREETGRDNGWLKQDPTQTNDVNTSIHQFAKDRVELTNTQTKASNGKKSRLSIKGVVIICTILVISTAAIVKTWTSQQEVQPIATMPNTGCMYWMNDHYEPMPCDEDKEGVLKLPLDADRMQKFKRILREDTITEKSIGKIYYLKIDGTIEYYTSKGNHPIDNTRILKVLTRYMFEKYLKK